MNKTIKKWAKRMAGSAILAGAAYAFLQKLRRSKYPKGRFKLVNFPKKYRVERI